MIRSAPAIGMLEATGRLHIAVLTTTISLQPLTDAPLLICLTTVFSIFLLSVKCDTADSSHFQTGTAMISSPSSRGFSASALGHKGRMLRFGRRGVFPVCLSLPGSNACGASPTGCQEQLYQIVAIENVSRRTNACPELGPWGRRAKLFLVYKVNF